MPVITTDTTDTTTNLSMQIDALKKQAHNMQQTLDSTRRDLNAAVAILDNLTDDEKTFAEACDEAAQINDHVHDFLTANNLTSEVKWNVGFSIADGAVSFSVTVEAVSENDARDKATRMWDIGEVYLTVNGDIEDFDVFCDVEVVDIVRA